MCKMRAAKTVDKHCALKFKFVLLSAETELERFSRFLNDSLLNIIQLMILRRSACMREAISTSERLAVTLK